MADTGGFERISGGADTGGFARVAPVAPPKVYYDDAGQPFTVTDGKPQYVKQQEPTSYTGSILPFRRDESGLHLAVPEAVMAPVRGAVEGGQRAAGVGEAGQNPLRTLSPDTLATVGALAGTRAAGMGDIFGGPKIASGGILQAPSAEIAAAREAQQAARTQKAANQQVSQTFNEGASAGAPTAMDVLERFAAARREKQPFTLSDIENPELRALVGSIYRQGGPARTILKSFYETRNADQISRVRGLLDKYLSDKSMKEVAEDLAQERSVSARPLWEEAARGESLAPLEHQYSQAYDQAVAAEAQAQQKVTLAQQAITLSSSKQSVAGNVYSRSAANDARREANRVLTQAQEELKAAQQGRQQSLEKLRSAQSDRETNVPGGIWSPYLDRLYQEPEIRQGINRGAAIERRMAAGENRPFNPTDYAITGFDEKGDPIVGNVPNMRLWMVAKEGLDAIIDDMKNPLTGRPTKAGLSYIKLRDGLVHELDRMNPAYKEARDQWSGYTQSLSALHAGKHFDHEATFTPEELSEYVNKLTPSDREFFILGVADNLKARVRKVADSGDKAKRIYNEDTRIRLRSIFPDQQQADQFLQAVQREVEMKDTPFDIYGGSRTQERTAEDIRKKAEKTLHFMRAAVDFARGRVISGGQSLLRGSRMVSRNPDDELNAAIARIVINPDVAISGVPGVSLFPAVRVPEIPKTGPGFPQRRKSSYLYVPAPGAAFGENDQSPASTMGAP